MSDVTLLPARAAGLPEVVQVSKSPLSTRRSRTRRRRGRVVAAALAGALVAAIGGGLPASAVPAGDEPGVTMRAFQLGQPIS